LARGVSRTGRVAPESGTYQLMISLLQLGVPPNRAEDEPERRLVDLILLRRPHGFARDGDGFSLVVGEIR
jgi:hypothetical protein